MAQKCKTGQVWNTKLNKCVSSKKSVSGHQEIDTKTTKKGGLYTQKQTYKVPAKEVGGGGGDRYYTSAATSRSKEGARMRAKHGAMFKMTTTPADSIPASQIYGKPKKKKKWW